MATSYEKHIEWVASRRDRLESKLWELFPEPARLSLEIGCGHGHWLTEFALRRPEKRCVGVDIISDRIERAKRKQERAGASNVLFLKAEAMELLDLLPEHVVLDEVFILFPDPWPKKRHWKNRLFCGTFLAELAARCGSGTRCYFRTDHDEYFKWAEEVIEEQSLWEKMAEFEWPLEKETVFQARADSYQSLAIVKQ